MEGDDELMAAKAAMAAATAEGRDGSVAGTAMAARATARRWATAMATGDGNWQWRPEMVTGDSNGQRG